MVSFEDFCRLFDETLDKTGFVVVKKENSAEPDEAEDKNTNTNKATYKLLPCPFCGKEALLKTHWKMEPGSNKASPHKEHYVSCSRCFCRTPDYFTENYAVEAWNKRISNAADTKKKALETTYLKNIAGYGKAVVDFAETCEKLIQKD